ncbi:MAG: hypothetical protein AMXMBFR57_11860 [Acidimicrobiia bacterium]|jgi:asparagine synthase (glutamine-hydrolysing)
MLGAVELSPGALAGFAPRLSHIAAPPHTSFLAFGTQPVIAGHTAFQWRGRLDNRREVAALLGGASGVASDAELVLAAHLRWGLRTSELIEGDWQFAAWDRSTRRLVLSRDVYGNSAWYYTRANDVLVFASSLPGLIQVLPALRPSKVVLARNLVAWRSPDGTETAYESVFRVPPAHLVEFSAASTQAVRYWILEQSNPLPTADTDAQLREFAEKFDRAVERRLSPPGPFASTLSAGLDSSAVTATAARILGARGESLFAVTTVPAREFVATHGAGSPGDEGPLAAEVARSRPNIRHCLVHSADMSPVRAVRRMLEIQGQPGIAAANYYWILSMLESVRADGCRTLLTGQMGNAVWSWGGSRRRRVRLADLRRKLRRLGQEDWRLRLWQRAQQHTAEPWRAYSAIHTTLATDVNLAQRMAEARHDPRFRWVGRSERRARLALLLPASIPIGGFWSHLGRAFGIEVRDPSQDRQLLEMSWALPMHLWTDGYDRAVIRRIMSGRLPDSVRLHPGGHAQAIDLGARLRASFEELDAALDEIAGSPEATAAVDIDRCRGIAERVRSGPLPSGLELKAVLMRGLDVGLFLAGGARQPERRRDVPWFA